MNEIWVKHFPSFYQHGSRWWWWCYWNLNKCSCSILQGPGQRFTKWAIPSLWMTVGKSKTAVTQKGVARGIKTNSVKKKVLWRIWGSCLGGKGSGSPKKVWGPPVLIKNAKIIIFTQPLWAWVRPFVPGTEFLLDTLFSLHSVTTECFKLQWLFPLQRVMGAHFYRPDTDTCVLEKRDDRWLVCSHSFFISETLKWYISTQTENHSTPFLYMLKWFLDPRTHPANLWSLQRLRSPNLIPGKEQGWKTLGHTWISSTDK